jgi:hypothetical protein
MDKISSATTITASVAGGGTPVALRVGQVITATVIGAEGEELVLRFAGCTLRASAFPGLVPGDTVHLRVQGVMGDRLQLQLVQRLARPQGSLQAYPAAQVLGSLSLPRTDENVAALRALLEHGCPITRSAVANLVAAWRELGGGSPETLRLLALLQAGALPLSAASLRAAQLYQAGERGLSYLRLSSLSQSLLELAQELRRDGDLKSLRVALTLLARSVAALPQRVLDATSSPVRLAALLDNLASPAEAVVSKGCGLVSRQDWPGGLEVADMRGTSDMTAAQEHAVPLLAEEQGAEEANAADGQAFVLRNPGTEGRRLPVVEQHLPTQLARLRSQLEQLLAGGKFAAAQVSALAQECLAEVSAAIDALDAQNIFNARQDPLNPWGCELSFALPVKWTTAGEDVTLRFSLRRNRRGRVDPFTARVGASLTIPGVGHIQAEVRTVGKLASCLVVADSELLHVAAKAEVVSLAQNISALGYQVCTLDCTLGKVQPAWCTTRTQEPPGALSSVDLVI